MVKDGTTLFGDRKDIRKYSIDFELGETLQKLNQAGQLFLEFNNLTLIDKLVNFLKCGPRLGSK